MSVINIAVAGSADSVKWKNKKVTWSWLVNRLSEWHKTHETYKEFIAMSKEQQSKIKDVGGYLGGYLKKGVRNKQSVESRQLITLDIDFAHTGLWEDFCMQFDNAALLHSTHKHHTNSPRYRLIMPLSREVTPDEYVAISRKIASFLDIELFDNTTFQAERFMFWQSNPKDVDYEFHYQDGEWVNADEVLGFYKDWTDTSEWPVAAKYDITETSKKHQEDPESKQGIVGAFCRTYGIADVINTFLKEVYLPTTEDNRYTYAEGTTYKGLIVYDDKFAYSHHSTDPCSNQTCNSFDLVRLHKFGNTKESFKQMQELILKDKRVKKTLADDNLHRLKEDFPELEQEDDNNWMTDLEVDKNGKYLAIYKNLNLILANDPRLKQVFKLNGFDKKAYLFKKTAWRNNQVPESMNDADFAGLKAYIENIYGIYNKSKTEDTLVLELEKNKYHPVRKYLTSLKWDGKKRVDTLLIDYFNVSDSVYYREAIRVCLLGAVNRVFKPGCKFDTVLTLVGKQGIGKSTFFKKLGGQWFSDTFMTVHGKEALEQIQGAWIIEIAELSGLRKAEVESIKHFISKQEDRFRFAYGKTIQDYPRQCVFVATTNNNKFLKDPTGNRRFLPVDVERGRISVIHDLDKETIDQIWAEVYQMYKADTPVILSAQAERTAVLEQRNHSDTDERMGIIEEYLNTLLPKKWDKMSVIDRRVFLENDAVEIVEKGIELKQYVCVAEIWAECLGKEKKDMDRYKTREINEILKNLEGWKQGKSTKHFKHYGIQRYYERIN